ncbi:hypothetical protein QOZ80_3AG0216650 [Eleusine coracana subsp. coracana]|nr:hypothetical protein QOZ80_3AG0216650 [Eleusine coracana subsp. coracana]
MAPPSLSSDAEDLPSRRSDAADVAGNVWDLAAVSPPSAGGREIYIYRNRYDLVPRSVGGGGRLRSLKFFGNDVEVLPPDGGGELDGLESLQIKVSAPRVSGAPLRRMRLLKELELSMVPPRPSSCSILAEIAGLKCLTKLTISHFSIRYLPPEIGSLRKLQELDLSFNKLKNLPNCIIELSALKFLKVTNNKLVDVPPGISSLRCLESLDLSNNRLTSLGSVKFVSMLMLQYLNLQFNRLSHSYEIPSWICCDMRGNSEATKGVKLQCSAVGSMISLSESRTPGCSTDCALSCSHLEGSPNLKHPASQKLKKGWKRRDCLQQRARQERLDSSRSKLNTKYIDEMAVNMAEDEYPLSLHDMEIKLEKKRIDEETSVHDDPLKETSSISDDASSIVDDDLDGVIKDSGMMLQDHPSEEKSGMDMRNYHDNNSCISVDPSFSRGRIRRIENELEDTASSVHDVGEIVQENSSESKCTSKSKRHPDMDSNPKPSKFPRPIDECSKLSYKYSVESFCSIDDHLPDGFYDAGRDMPFMSLEEYERSLGLYAREVILLDREKDEELDAIASSAQLLLSSLKRPSSFETDEDEGHDFLRASVLALFVSDCFGGCDRSASLGRTRRSIISLRKEQPFICTCYIGNVCDISEVSKQTNAPSGHFDFTGLCDRSIHIIKERRNSGIVPIGALQFGVCRHRAVLMKYLCDRADPPIPCELVRGHLDYTPHAWNVVPVRKGNDWVRMIVDACYPSNIKEETDPEYFCRYIPLSRLHVSLDDESYTSPCSFPSVSLCKEIEVTASSSVYHCKIGEVDAAAKVRYLDTRGATHDEIKNFEYKLLGEVRMLGALRKHRSIVDIYGHQFSSKWVQDDGGNEYRILQSVILMEYVNGGSLKGYLSKLLKEGKKHVPIDLAFYIAQEVACALSELHKKLVIHRDIKSENVLIDLNYKSSDTLLVKLSDFDRSIPLHSLSHTCCIAHLGAHPPNVCVGTPCWMAPEVLQAMHEKHQYGLEVDIWSFGCFLLEMLTLQIPYQGLPDSEIYDHIMRKKQRPRLTQELEAFWAVDEPVTRLKLGITSDAHADKLRRLIDLFYQCTRGNASRRPKAEQIYNSLCSLPTCYDMR